MTGLVFILAGLGMTQLARTLQARQIGFRAALTTTGTIVGFNMKEHDNESADGVDHTDYFLKFRYAAGGKTFIGEDSVDAAFYKNACIGDRRTVYFRKSNPEDGVLIKPTGSLAFAFIGVPFALMGAGLIVSSVRDRFRAA